MKRKEYVISVLFQSLLIAAVVGIAYLSHITREHTNPADVNGYELVVIAEDPVEISLEMLRELTDSMGSFRKNGMRLGASPAQIKVVSGYNPDSLKYKRQFIHTLKENNLVKVDLFMQFSSAIAQPFFEDRRVIKNGKESMEEVCIGTLFDDEATTDLYGVMIEFPSDSLAHVATRRCLMKMHGSGLRRIKETPMGSIHAGHGNEAILVYGGKESKLLISCFDTSISDMESMKSLLDNEDN